MKEQFMVKSQYNKKRMNSSSDDGFVRKFVHFLKLNNLSFRPGVIEGAYQHTNIYVTDSRLNKMTRYDRK